MKEVKNWGTIWKVIDKGLKDTNREDLWKSSVIYPNSSGFTRILNEIKPEIVVELGTYRGLSTVILAFMCEKVYTYDIIYQKDTEFLWELFKVKNSIEYFYCGPQRDFPIPTEEFLILVRKYRPIIKQAIDDLEYFDFAVIDTYHDYENVKADFELVKRCGKVLFHDWRDSFPQIGKFMKEIGATKRGEFGYWEK